MRANRLGVDVAGGPDGGVGVAVAARGGTFAVDLEMRESDLDEPTPKLRAVTGWLAQMDAAGEADWDAVVWIDDVLGPDAQEWADRFRQPVLLEMPSPEDGLTADQVESVELFVDGGGG
ncbi:hypothetical protein M1E01_08570 [Arthrobacter sp. D1-17]